MRFVWELSPLLELRHLRTSGPVSTGIPVSFSADHFPHTSAISARYSLALSYLAFIFFVKVSVEINSHHEKVLLHSESFMSLAGQRFAGEIFPYYSFAGRIIAISLSEEPVY